MLKWFGEHPDVVKILLIVGGVVLAAAVVVGADTTPFWHFVRDLMGLRQ